MKFDVIIPCAGKDISFVPRVVTYVRKCFDDADQIYIITNAKFIGKLQKFLGNLVNECVILDENALLPGLTFGNVGKMLKEKKEGLSTGWFFQQFLKYAFALTQYADKYYLTWDADTLPLNKIKFFEDEHPYFTRKIEYNENYFKTIEKLLGIRKQNDFSFIAEHMMFDPVLVKELLSEIEKSSVVGDNWIEKIINAGDYDNPKPSFSEFETYGTYVSQKYPELYLTRQLNTFRCGGFIQGRNITDAKLKTISFDCDTISFEYGHDPVFPYNIYCKFQFYWLIFVTLRKYSLAEIIKRIFNL